MINFKKFLILLEADETQLHNQLYKNIPYEEYKTIINGKRNFI